MNHRQRFYAVMHYQDRDRVPLFDFSVWDDTLTLWKAQGLPERLSKARLFRYFGMDYSLGDVTFATGTNMGLMPSFEERVLEDQGDREIFQQADGVRVLRQKKMGSIPQHLGHLLTDRESWRKHYRPRLDPDHPERMPPDLAVRILEWSDPDHPSLVVPWIGGLYGWIRDWMGMEAVSMVVYDDPAFFEEMVATIADCMIGTLARLLAAGAKIDACAFWEDMCYNAGPLIHPRHFKQYLVPHYRRITDLLHRYGVDIVWVDCDGRIDKLVPLWLNSGVNCMFPLEIGSWGADPLRFRQEYGKDLRLMGGFSKRILAGTKAEIDREVFRLAPLVEEGGYIPFCDHLVPPDVPFENYWHYCKKAREVWGHGVDLAPMGIID
jgi:hypothetical protein